MSSEKKISLSVVIVSYNVRQYVLDAIRSLHRFCDLNLQIIVSDNNSNDGTVNSIKEQFPEVLIIENKENLGFSKANNQGFEKCTGDYVLMLNPDAELLETGIQKMVVFMEKQYKNDDILIGPRLINTDNSYQQSCWKFPNPFQHLLELFFLNFWIDITKYDQDELISERQVDFLSGACILMSKKTVSKLNGLDPDLFWMEDVDLCKRNIEFGGKNIYYPYYTVKHHIGKSSLRNQNVVISNQIISKLKYYKKHGHYLSYAISLPIFLLQIITRMPLFLIIGIVKPFYFTKVKAYGYTFLKFIKYLIFAKQKLM